MSRINVRTKEKRFPVTPSLYGIFFEDINRSGDGGLYPEMLRDRSFEDAILPEGCVTNDGGKTMVSPTGWITSFNGGEGLNGWVENSQIAPTPIPAWYAENAQMSLDMEDTLNSKRKASLTVAFQPGGRIFNIGYAGVPQKAGETYNFYAFIKTEAPVTLELTVEENGDVLSRGEIRVNGNEWIRYDCTLLGTRTTGNGKFCITCREGGTVRFGFSSLMPADTYNGHGLRRDLVEKLRDMKPAFLRFPGGCIVEGFTKETVMYFRNVVGPVWERPSHWLLWHYRASNGLGFHEYLQLCEDLDISALYVCNCAMTCQGRCGSYFDEEELKTVIQDTLSAIEYAVGPADSQWGSLRARMGHAAPFKLEYLEIGNENSGPEYASRFYRIKAAVLARYPDIKIITNQKGLIADIVDDHYYEIPEFFAKNYDMYKDYDRSKPEIFVGEFAVMRVNEGQLRGAIAEAMFMVGLERNQDAVKLASYAPLFAHESYFAWYPNLIIFDNHRNYAIPTYYAWRLFGKHRGENVVKSEEQARWIHQKMTGLPAISGDYGMRYRGAKWNGEPVFATHETAGKLVADGEDMVLDRIVPKYHYLVETPSLVVLGEDIEASEGRFEVEVLADGGREIGLGILCKPVPKSFHERNKREPLDPWELYLLQMFRWVIRDGKSFVLRGFQTEKIGEEKTVRLRDGEYNKLAYVIKRPYVELYLNDELIDTVELPGYPSMCSVVTDTEDEIIIKAVNFADVEDDIEITLDCDVADSYTVGLLTGKAEDENTLEDPENVRDVYLEKKGAARNFTYRAPALSVNVLILKKA